MIIVTIISGATAIVSLVVTNILAAQFVRKGSLADLASCAIWAIACIAGIVGLITNIIVIMR